MDKALKLAPLARAVRRASCRKWLTAVACMTFASAFASPAEATVGVDGDPVVFWNQILTQNIVGSPVLTSRSYAMVEVAIYDALNATTGNTRSSYTGVSASTGDTRAAASTAAHDVLLFLLPPNGTQARTDQRNAIEQSYQASLGLIAPGQARTDGIATGAAAASNIITMRTGDGSAAPAVPVYSPTNPPVDGHWQQTTPGAAGAPVTPWWGAVTPWALNSGDQFRPAGPPDINSPQFAAALAEVMAIGASDSATRTAAQTASAQYWAVGGNGLAPWINAAIGAADGKNFSSLDYAAMFALLSTNVADATIGVFDAKYVYDFWRPVTAIHDADPNSAWTSLITAPSHPSYISGHSAVGGAAAVSLMYFLGEADACFSSYICFDNFELAAEDGANSRLWGGIHYSFDNQAGLTLGHSVGQFGLAAGTFTSVPEPATWLTMLVGFGFIGWRLRRQRWAPRAGISA
jgi:hypothetical protein